MTKQTKSSKSKRALLVGNATGNTVQINIYSLTSKLADNPNANNAITPSLDAASSQPDVALTFQGNSAGEPAVTPPGTAGEDESKAEVEVTAAMDQIMSPVENEQTTSEANLVASTTSNSSNVPASQLHLEMSQHVDGNPVKVTDFSQPEWEIPTPRSSMKASSSPSLRRGPSPPKIAVRTFFWKCTLSFLRVSSIGGLCTPS